MHIIYEKLSSNSAGLSIIWVLDDIMENIFCVTRTQWF